MYNNIKNIDSIQRRDPVLIALKRKQNFVKPEIKKEVEFYNSPSRNYASLRRSIFVFSIVLASVAISVATQGFAFTRNEESNKVQEAIAVQNKIPIGPTLVQENISVVNPVVIPIEEPKQVDPLQERKSALKKYLNAKGSPLASYSDTIAEQEHWKLIIGIASAESSLCQKYPASTYNCWGVGGAWDLHKYSGFAEAITKVNSLLDRKYYDLGLTTPKKIVNKWVGHPNPNWVAAVDQEIANLSNIE
jgi:hypothetical protein